MSGVTRDKPTSSRGVSFPTLPDPLSAPASKHATSAAALRARLIAHPEILTNPDAIRVIRPVRHAERKELAKLDPLPQLRLYQELNRPKDRAVSSVQSSISEQRKRSPDRPPTTRGTAVGPSTVPTVTRQYKKRKGGAKLKEAKNFADQINDDPLIGLTDPLELVIRIKNQPGFKYMTAAVPQSSIDYHPYNLRVVVHENINPNDYYTISATGVTRLREGETEYTTLGAWEKEYRNYQILIKIKTFSNFRMWKAFAVWRKNVRSKKISKCKNDLKDNLFIVNDSLRPALISVRDMCYRIGDMNLCRFDKDLKYKLKQFQDAQLSQLNEVTDRLAEFRELVKEVVRRACANALFEAGFPLDETGSGFGSPDPDDEFQRDGTSVLMLNQYEMQMYVEQQEKATYTEQANKRAHCRRLTSFIRLADYLIVHTMHTLAVNSVSMLLSYLVTHSKCNYIPDAMKPQLNVQEDEQHLSPLFITELLMELNGLYFTPNSNHYLMGMEEIIRRIQDSTLSVKNLVTDDYFHSFTKPKINDKFEEHAVGEGPSLAAIFEDDKHLQTLIQSTNDTIEKAFELAWKYAESFEPFRQYYRDNENLDVEAVGKGEHDVKFFAESLAEYKRQHEETTCIVGKLPVGMLECDATKLKMKMLPSPQKCLEAINDRLPKLARQKNDALIETTQGATSKLEVVPSSTVEFVESLTFLDEIQEKTQEIEEEANVIRALYDLIEKYNVPAPPEDVAVYQTLTPSVNNMLQAIDKSLADRDANIEKFCSHLDKDIAILSKKVKEVKLRAQSTSILDPTSDMDEVLGTLLELHTTMNELQEQATEYKGYQKQFKVDVTRFDELEETHAEVRMKQQLWESLQSWDLVTGEWFELKFDQLNPEDITQKVQKYAKSVFQMERGLPPNGVVPLLKEKVDDMKNKVPVITNLRNQSLKPRHWEEIEHTLNSKFDPAEHTLATLQELEAFQFAGELEEIAGKASSEANLETMLRKVEEDWKNTEFTAIPHGKDVFILGGLDEIIALLDDSVVNISTIAGSRHVGPIKPRVEDWQKQLSLFADTLDEWQTCQRNWLYLESIFSAPDIQRQLPNEAKMFLQVDKTWKEIMRKVQRIPNAMRAATQPGLLETFQNNNSLLDQINKCLEDYLESKRLIFPRFYFLSNDELLQILAQTRNPLAVQPHLSKCFDAIKSLEFGTVQDTRPGSGERAKTPSQVQHSNDVIAMLSPDGERVALSKGLKARGNVENWLGAVEENMMITLRKLLKVSLQDYEVSDKNDWVVSDFSHASQIILAVSQITWCKDCTECLTTGTDKVEKMKGALQRSIDNLTNLASLVRQEIPKLIRNILGAKITIDVHLRDICSILVQKKVNSVHEFEWLKQLRYYWDTEIDNCVIRMSNSYYIYGYEYLGASMRLVITPLTDRCYLCLMGALQLDLGGAPAGPAGTGKTETTKDLAKALAKQCVVFNCSESLDYKMMGKFFSGLSSTGSWCCFDEFNRIDIEVLSVIAQQLLTIRNAKAQKMPKFMFEGRELKLNPACAAFITMNPGYAGRTELPDNLKALFRPFAMMVPDYTLIAEVILYSEGFEDSLTLAHKMTRMYALCSEQLSQQDHYDFGMRAVKSVLVMAGSLKRENPDKREDVVLLRALRDSNLPKFLHEDTILFQAILQDLFPGLEIPEHDYGIFKTTVEECILAKNLQTKDCVIKKVIQFFETMQVRHGVMLVGPTGGGKTVCYEVLADTLTKLHKGGYGKKVPDYRPVHTKVLNPKAVSMGELYGEFNLLTMEWKDGLLATAVRAAVEDRTEDHKWIVNDGPVDALWIENMNTVLDDNKMLCLANSERIKLDNTIHMVFEVQDLSVASPATVSRCGMVYIDADELGWRPLLETWLSNKDFKWKDETRDYVWNMFNTYVDPCLKYVRKNLLEAMPQVALSKVQTVALLFESLVFGSGGPDLHSDPLRLHCLLATTFAWCLTWGLGGNLDENCNDKFDSYIKDLLSDCPDVKMAATGDVYSCYMDMGRKVMESWEKITPTFKYDPELPYFDIMVPTIDTTRFGYLMELLIKLERPVLFTGGTGVGKSVIAKQKMLDLGEKDYIPAFVNFSAQTNSQRTQDLVVNKLEKKRKNTLGAPKGKKMIILVDDLNMPKLETYGAQPPVELLRQFQDFRGFYDRDKLHWIEIQDVILSAACAPPGGGRNPVTPRFVRHFSMFSIPSAADFTLKTIFTAIIKGFLQDFPPAVKEMAGSLVSAAVEIYARMSTDLLPTPAKAHYIFNLRDLSKLVQGVLQADVGYIREPIALFRLFCHESLRVFHDRLIDTTDKRYFCDILSQMSSKHFNQDYAAETFEKKPIIFGDFMKVGAESKDRVYEDIKDSAKLEKVLGDYLDDYNMSCPKEMKLVFFLDAIQHISRIARMVRQPRGNALLVGVGGTGKQSLTRLACHMAGYTCIQIELTRGYNYDSFHEDLKLLYQSAGVEGNNTVFLFTDTQIVVEEFLEDINNILNSGEISNLFPAEEFEAVINAVRPKAKEAGVSESDRDGIYDHFISRVRDNLHIVLCMSPVGDAFRGRCRMFPSIVNCCTIDWFTQWPTEALLSVSKQFFADVEIGVTDEVKEALCVFCEVVHTSVTNMSERYYAELRRHVYTTPTSYLELINLYLSMLNDKRKQLSSARDRVANGLKKLLETNDLVANMEVELTALGPELKKKSEDTDILMVKLEKDQIEADKVRAVVSEEEAIAKEKAEETEAIAEDAQRDLDEALPLLYAANKALDSLDKSDIAEVRVFANPPEMVMTVMEAVCILLSAKPDWAGAKGLLGDSAFLRRLVEYDKDNIPESILRKLKKYIDNPKFVPEIVEKTSRACKSLCLWVRAIDSYAHVFRTVEPKRAKLVGAQEELAVVQAELAKKQASLQEVEDKIKELQDFFDSSVREKESLQKNIALTAARLKRAGRLVTALGDEQVRWDETVKEFQKEIDNVAGNVFIASACVAYYGPFTANYREMLVKEWITRCQELGIPVSEDFQLVTTLADPFEIRQWNLEGLPRDSVSTENAVLVTKGRRWPLMIDPQDQANRWIVGKERKNGLKVVKLTDKNLLRTLENAIRIGLPVLIEEVGETLDPALEPILLKQTFMQGGRLLIRLGDSDVDYDKNFRFYMTSKLANPHYMPEIFIKVTIINFTVTRLGLEDQLLADVVRLERPDLEEQRNKLIMKINSDKQKLKDIEDKILKMLFHSEGNILDDEELIETLNDSKVISKEINARLKEAVKTEEMISRARAKYLPVATRGSVIYFVTADLAEIDPMYQYSLKYFTSLFVKVIETSEKASDLEKRLQILLEGITLTMYNNIGRGLFERHKVIFSFMLCVEIMKQADVITMQEWNFFIRGLPPLEKDRAKKPGQCSFLEEATWNLMVDVEEAMPVFSGITNDIKLTPVHVSIGSYTLKLNPDKFAGYVPIDKVPYPPADLSEEEVPPGAPKGHWNKRLNSFQRLILVKYFRSEALVECLNTFVVENLGKEFVENPPQHLGALYQDMVKEAPLIFVLSSGSDPMAAFLRFAKERDYEERVHSISLGQGQGPVAEKLIFAAVKTGDWVFLQNCHLAKSWMLAMEEIIKDFSSPDAEIHEDFRLYLSSMPAPFFPVSVLQNGIKVTSEPPKGLRSNLRRAFGELTKGDFQDHILKTDWCKIIFGICFFHAVVLERRKFGPLAFNIPYEFADSDRECAIDNFKLFTSDGELPWDALQFITAEITYGGRVTDAWDQRVLKVVLSRFFRPETLEPGYQYSTSDKYHALETTSLDSYKEFVESLPIIDPPEIFDMYENANTAYQKKESQQLVNTILEVQPRLVSGGGGKSSDEIVFEMADLFLSKLPEKLDIDDALEEMFEPDEKGRINSLSTVLAQEVVRFNKLLATMIGSLTNIKKAIKGLAVMSEQLEEIFNSMVINVVPKQWADAAYPSLKPLGSWMKDLELRLQCTDLWMRVGQPKSFWISGFFFPQGFITGALQNFARKYDVPIDALKFRFEVLPHYRSQTDVAAAADTPYDDSAYKRPADGVLIHGLFLDSASWDDDNNVLGDARYGVMNPPMPVMHLLPDPEYEPEPDRYDCPLYKTAERAGTLSTTGHSTNFVIKCLMPSDKSSEHWIGKGTALLCQLSH